jgi:hypothetical protein
VGAQVELIERLVALLAERSGPAEGSGGEQSGA